MGIPLPPSSISSSASHYSHHSPNPPLPHIPPLSFSPEPQVGSSPETVVPIRSPMHTTPPSRYSSPTASTSSFLAEDPISTQTRQNIPQLLEQLGGMVINVDDQGELTIVPPTKGQPGWLKAMVMGMINLIEASNKTRQRIRGLEADFKLYQIQQQQELKNALDTFKNLVDQAGNLRGNLNQATDEIKDLKKEITQLKERPTGGICNCPPPTNYAVDIVHL